MNKRFSLFIMAILTIISAEVQAQVDISIVYKPSWFQLQPRVLVNSTQTLFITNNFAYYIKAGNGTAFVSDSLVFTFSTAQYLALKACVSNLDVKNNVIRIKAESVNVRSGVNNAYVTNPSSITCEKASAVPVQYNPSLALKINSISLAYASTIPNSIEKAAVAYCVSKNSQLISIDGYDLGAPVLSYVTGYSSTYTYYNYNVNTLVTCRAI